jgi:hypothetical protein
MGAIDVAVAPMGRSYDTSALALRVGTGLCARGIDDAYQSLLAAACDQLTGFREELAP